MRITTFILRTLRYHGRTNLAVLLGVITGSAALTGALIVGDSMRASLRDKALERLGPVDYALLANRFVRERLADDLAASAALARDHDAVVPIIHLRAAATRPDTKARANHVHVLGVDARFWGLAPVTPTHGVPDHTTSRARSVVLNATLAARLHAGIGDDILLRIGKPADVPIESLLGRRDNTTVTLRLTVGDVLDDVGLGAFNLNSDQHAPANAYVPLPTLQQALHKAGRVNTLLITAPHTAARAIRALLAEHIDLADLGVRLRTNDAFGYVAIENDAVLLPPEIEGVALPAARELGQTLSILTYLANDLRVVGPASTSGPDVRSVPYSTVTAIDTLPPGPAPFERVDGFSAAAPKPGEILLNDWTARRLHARIGDKIRLSYFVTDTLGHLDTRAESFTLAGIVRLDGAAADADFAPDYPGITDTRRLADWDPPFPIDLGRIDDDDEAYWERHRTTPKAFIALTDGQHLWASDAARFGKLTACRLYPAHPDRLAREADALAQHLRGGVDLDHLGLTLTPVRRQAAAGTGSTEFGGLFVGFSFFLILSACLLVALLFRLGVERRSASIGLLLATGFSSRQVSGLLLAEGALLAVAGSAVGLLAALAYAALMLASLRTWWSDAVHAPFLRLHATPASFLIGFAASAGVALAAIAWSLRGLTRQSPRALLAGAAGAIPWAPPDHPARRSTAVALLAAILATALITIAATTDALPPAPVFFSSGALLLLAVLAAFNRLLRSATRRSIQRPGAAALATFGLRNARRHAGRSLLTIALVASATFVITAMQVFRLNAGDADSTAPSSPTGGFPLYAESATPLPYDLNTPAGREALGILEPAAHALDGVTAIPFRLRPGDEASCLNLYKPAAPRILGAPEAMIRRGGFSFAATMAESAGEKKNPWTLLNRAFPDDDAVPVIGDEAAVLWQLHLGLGKDLITTDERGRKVPLRFVALLRGSALQGELVIAESRFKQLCPSIGGYGFFLIDTPPQTAATVERTLERELAAYGFDVTPTADRLRDYYAVQNTYLSTFQTLGGFGLVLGTIGMAAVLLRNTWERRGELALMRAIGLSHAQVRRFVLTETAALIVAGLIAGSVPALVAVAPFVAAHAGSIPWRQLGALLTGVLAIGLSACLLAVHAAVRGKLIAALRSE
ncbi:MAG: FtsX-like permease family protein [Phycisphaerae bacterium]